MNGIHITALLTSVLAAIGMGTLIHRLRQPADGRLLLLAVLVMLPLQPLVFHLVRMPLDQWLVGHLGRASVSYQWLTSLYAPLTEEPSKLVVLLIPAILRDIRPENFVRYALAIGLGFAIGEMWFVADRISLRPALAALPFHQFGGYVVERLMTCVFHAAFVALALSQLRRRFLLGFAGAVAAHWLANFPILLMNWNVGGLGQATWGLLVSLWLSVLLIGAMALLAYFILGRASPGRLIFGRRHCPGCSADYDAPLIAVNFGITRYERCPHCRGWHWTKACDA
ncbi:MAG TPA: hypothetical protein PLA50_16280 [Bacteroidia bacterium]|nr:hypothetical protein [Bacteroidia bacterium]